MKKLLLITIALCIFVSCKTETKKLNPITVDYPETKKVDTVNTYFGENVVDPYRWLEDDRSTETEEWVKSQNETTFGYLAGARANFRTCFVVGSKFLEILVGMF